ncbi:cellulase N-terminal Ig-like domain-containing protein [Streptosporangium sp. CA-135522]|uniref:cellulase N-terminal Ig-like domain-containing protein n=1 Tax=Streptosporangium sp. CA-135522 TaxID=3240072 RepID=UPI003D8E8849
MRSSSPVAEDGGETGQEFPDDSWQAGRRGSLQVPQVDQVAYVPGVPKQATVVTSTGTPQTWTLKNSGGATIATCTLG